MIVPQNEKLQVLKIQNLQRFIGDLFSPSIIFLLVIAFP